MKIKNTTLSALLVSLTIVLLALNTILPISTISILTVTSAIIPIAIIKTSVRNSILIYISSSLLGLLLLPKDIVILYIMFFGIYGLIKFFIEKLNNLYFEIPLKIIFSSLVLLVYYFVFNSFINLSNIDLPLYLIFIGANIAFLIYDYALTMLISYYIEKINNRL